MSRCTHVDKEAHQVFCVSEFPEIHRIVEYPELQWTHKDIEVQFLSSNKLYLESWLLGKLSLRLTISLLNCYLDKLIQNGVMLF